MRGSSRAAESGSAKPQRATERQAPTVPCDLCGLPFRLPTEIIAQGVIRGLLVCTQCIEDQLEARNYERTCEAH